MAKLKFKFLTLMISVLLVSLMIFLRVVPLFVVKAELANHNLTEIVPIETTRDLDKLADRAFLGRTFLLKNDIDLLGVNWTPLDTDAMSGTFDGGGHAIKNLAVNVSGEYTGLFSKNGLHVKNLFINDLTIAGGENTGGLAGLNKGKIDNVHINGDIGANYSAGGLFAENYGDIDNCSVNGSVTSRTAAGLVASNSGSTITNSYSIGAVKGQKIGGLISSVLKASVQEQKIVNSFSFCEMTLLKYDETINRIGGFIAVREQGVLIENCYSGNDYPCIAFGDFNGVKELSADNQQDKNSYIGFDFDNDWNWSNDINKITQRTVAVSSNTVVMDGVVVIVKGDKSYYNNSETATISVFAEGKNNFGILDSYIDGSKVTFDPNGTYQVEVKKQINVQFTPQYLLRVELNQSTQHGVLKQTKQYYAPNEPIIFDAIPDEHSTFNQLTATYLGSYVHFVPLDGNKYEAKLPHETNVFTKDSILFIDASFTYHAPFNWFILVWIALAMVGAGGMALFIIYRKKIAKVINKKVLFLACMSLLALIAVCAIIVWILLLCDVIIAGSLQIWLLVLMPIIAAASVVGIWSIHAINHSYKREK